MRGRCLKVEPAQRLRRLTGALTIVISALSGPVVAGPTPGPPLVGYDQRVIDYDRVRCANGAGPTEIQECNDRAIAAAIKAGSTSPANPHFEAFLSNLFEPLLFEVTGGEDVLAQRVVVSGELANFAGLRAQILSGQMPQLKPRKLGSTRREAFSRLSDRTRAADLQDQWTKIKAGDCAAYRVPNCDRHLEQALQQTLSEALTHAPPEGAPDGL